jgi:uncharacterized membrane protein YdbT with pleckstrin-like domain
MAAATTPSADVETVLFEGRPAPIPGIGALLIAIVTLGLAALYYLLRSQGVLYRVTTKRVMVERGILSKRLEQVDVYRIKDFVVERPFGQRIMGTGNILLLTMDPTTQEVKLQDLKTDVVGLYERLRAAAESERVRRGVRILDNE